MVNEYSEQRVRQIVREEVADIHIELTRRSGLLEDLYDKFTTLAELVSSSLQVRKQVNEREARVTNLETNQTLLAKTVRIHPQHFKQA